jgi:hypothetical protein
MSAAASVSDGLKNKVWSKMATDEVTILVLIAHFFKVCPIVSASDGIPYVFVSELLY